jgi:hypothetical protein
MHESSQESQVLDGLAPESSVSGDSWPMLPYKFNPLKHNRAVAGAALQLLKLRTRKLERAIFTATTGRSGTLTLSRIFSTVRGCISLHEAHPVMNGAVLRAASYGDTALVNRVYRRVKSVNIRRAAVGQRYYFEANHLFIKAFAHNAVEDFGDRIAVVHLVRPAVEVATSIYSLRDYPGTDRGNYWWLDFRAPTNRISIADLLESDPEFSHPFYKALWYWHEVEARIAAFRLEMPTVRFVRLQTEWLNDPLRMCDLLEDLGVEYDTAVIEAMIGIKEHTKDDQKIGSALPAEVAEEMASRFRKLLERLGKDSPPGDACATSNRRIPDKDRAVGSVSSIFHEPWWLSAATDGRYEEVVVEQKGKIVGRLPYLPAQRGLFRLSRMPPFTHLLGPVVDSGVGKPQTRLTRRLSITRALIDKLPRFIHFEQQLDPSLDDGMAMADGLAFQDRGFVVLQRYTFEIDCRKQLDHLWDAMHFKTRQHIRRAEEKYMARSVDDPNVFIDIYLRNVQALGRTNLMEFGRFPALFAQCRARNCGEILGAFAPDGSPVSMIFLVWNETTMYYLLSTRHPDPADNGSTSMLLWAAVKYAHERGLIFDLDGVYSSGAARFLSGFGGQIKTRLMVRRSGPVYGAWQYLKQCCSKNETKHYI